MSEPSMAGRCTGVDHPPPELRTVHLNAVASDTGGTRIANFFLPKGLTALDVTPDEEKRLRNEGRNRGVTFVDGVSPEKSALEDMLAKAQTDLATKATEARILKQDFEAERQAHALTKSRLESLSQAVGQTGVGKQSDLGMISPKGGDESPVAPKGNAPPAKK